MNLPHTVAVDPGIAWIKDETPAIDVPPDTETRPAPEARWSDNARRSGVCGAVTPDVVPVGDGTLRMYYAQILPRDGHPAGAADYDNATTRLLSALSSKLMRSSSVVSVSGAVLSGQGSATHLVMWGERDFQHRKSVD